GAAGRRVARADRAVRARDRRDRHRRAGAQRDGHGQRDLERPTPGHVASTGSPARSSTAAPGAANRSTSTRAEWNEPPPPRSVSSSVVSALALAPPGLREPHQPDGRATTPGPTMSPTRAR